MKAFFFTACVVLGVLLTSLDHAYSFVSPHVNRRILPSTCRANVLLMTGRGRGGGRGSGGSGSSSSSGGRGSGRGAKNVRLDQRDGARPLTRAEIKAKEIYDSTKEPEVPRLHASADRVSLAQLEAGQQLRGRIVSVKEFGLFVDVGAKRDGLVHVKDISKDYFIQNHEQKFIPGQDIDVWIKFVEDKSNKLGLQMFPLAVNSASGQSGVALSPSLVSLDDFDEEDEVSGTVVRVSNYGVFVDIGAGVEAFLHRRKMKLTKRQRSFKPWEISPLGSKVDCYIHELDHDRKRIALTTYGPEEWDEMLPLKIDEDAPMIEDEEELGGTAMASNLRALERTLSLAIDEDDEDGLLGDDDDDEGEELSAEEIRALTTGRSSQPQIVIDDFGGAPSGTSRSRGGSNSKSDGGGLPSPETLLAERRSAGAVTSMDEQAEEISIEELFQELCGKGRDYVTVRDVKKWDYLQDLIADGDLGDEDLLDLFDEAGAVQGKLLEDQFGDFIDLLADSLGLEEVGGDYDASMMDNDEDEDDDDEDEEDDEDIESVGLEAKLLMDDFNDAAPSASTASGRAATSANKGASAKSKSSAGKLSASHDDDDDDEEMDFGLGSGKPSETSLSSTTADSKKQPSSSSSAKSSSQSSTTASSSSDISATGESSPSSSSSSSSSSGSEGSLSLEDHYERRSKTNDLFQYVFTSVAGKKDHVTIADVVKWDFVQALLAQKTTTEAAVQALFNKCNPKGGKLSAKQFEALVSMLSEIETSANQTGPSAGAAAPGVPPSAAVLGQMKDQGRVQGVVDLTPRDQRTDVILSPPSKTIGRAATTAASDSSNPQDDEEAAAVAEAFQELSGGKRTVSLTTVAEWDLVAELMEEGMLTKDDLEEFFLQAAGQGLVRATKSSVSEPVLDLKGFETLLDLLAPLAGEYDDEDDDEDEELEEEEEEEEDEEEMPGDIVAHKEVGTRVTASATAGKDNGDTETDNDDDDEYTDEEEGELLSNVFANLANGKSYVSAKDMQNWDIVLELMGEGLLTDDLLREKMTECSGFTGKGVPLEGFDQLVDKLVELYGELDEFNGEASEDEGAATTTGTTKSTKKSDDRNAATGDDDSEEEDYIDIDTEEEFEAVAKGKDFVTFADLREWELIQQLREAGEMSDDDLREVIKAAGVEDEKNIDVLGFEAILDVLSAGLNEDDYEDEEDEGSKA